MRRFAFLVAFAVTATVAMAQTKNLNQITATKHNFNADGYAWADGEICKPCHTPHNAQQDANISTRLWNHKLTTASYTIHDGTTGVTYDQALDRYSRLCMSCHDGTVALDAFGRGDDGSINDGNSANTFNRVAANLGTDLMNDHPVGLSANFTAANVKPYYYSMLAPTGTSTTWKTGNGKLSLVNATVSGAAIQVVGCSTCHTPHGKGDTAGNPYKHLLAMDNTNSALCMSCHIK